jgi:hypothetical protein
VCQVIGEPPALAVLVWQVEVARLIHTCWKRTAALADSACRVPAPNGRELLADSRVVRDIAGRHLQGDSCAPGGSNGSQPEC